MIPAGMGTIERRHLAIAVLRAALEAAVIIVAYFVLPVAQREHSRIVIRLTIGLAFFAVVLAYEVRAIARSRHPMLRAAIAMALILPLFVVVFAWSYLTMSLSSHAAFGQRLSRISALYFTVTVFSTVGFGDITPHTDPARVAVMGQMIADLIVIAVVVRLLIGAARGALTTREAETDNTKPS
jgi:hypothetical protein